MHATHVPRADLPQRDAVATIVLRPQRPRGVVLRAAGALHLLVAGVVELRGALARVGPRRVEYATAVMPVSYTHLRAHETLMNL
eukprot:1652136-Prymnesium_polylepis.1